jgi:glycosyltransferase involved in cell wall biosynthesis
VQRLLAAAREGRFIFGSTGQAISRKGFDLLPQLIQACDQTFPDRQFLAVWVGAPAQNELCQFIKRDLALLGLEDQVLIIPPVASALALISQMQAFILLSREDPHPLVVLEAASLGIPTVCFEASGGIGEFVMDGRGLSVPYLDLQAMARSLYALSQDPQLRGDLGARARERVFQAHTLQQAAERILAIIETTASRR